MPDFAGFSALVCKSCSRPIALPPAKHPYTSQGQKLWPRDCAPRTFLCPVCSHLHEYQAEDVQLIPWEKAAQNKAKKPRSVVCIEVPCGAGGCASLVRIRTTMAFDVDPVLGAVEALAGSEAHGIPCGKGHILSGPIRSGTALGAHFDEEWETE